MKRMVNWKAAAGATLGLIALAACSDTVTSPEVLAPTVPSLGNGFPDNGKATLYKMNLIGHPGEVPSDNTGGEGKRILVRLWGNTRILLSPGEEFDILDANGTDGVASFQLPDPDPDNDGETWYGVYIRPQGKPFTGLNLTTCATGDFDNDPTTPDEELCSLEVKVLVREKGKPLVDNISKELLTLCVDTDGDQTCDERIFLFDDRASNYLWSADNSGLRNAEVRFLEIKQNIGLTP
jgi:hypothetical protein